MRNALPLVLLLLAAAGGWWLLAGAEDDPIRDLTDGPLEEAPRPAEPVGGPGLAAEGTAAPAKKAAPPPPYKVVDPRTLPTGVLLVRALGPDLEPLPARDLRIRVEPGPGGLWRTKLGLYDAETDLWRFERVVAGPVRVRVEGDFVIARTVDAVVPKEREHTLDVSLDRAGSIRYDVMAYDKTRPEKVRLTVFDWQDEPVKAWYQVRTSRRLTSPRFVDTAEIGPEGVVFGLLPGRYTVKVVSTFDEWDEAKVDVVAGKQATVSLTVRR